MDFCLEYEHWEDYFKGDYTKIYNKEQEVYSSLVNANGGDVNVLVGSAKRIFDASCHLLELFLRNNGYFQVSTKDILWHAFSVDFLPDGEEWMEFKNILYSEQTINLQYLVEFIVKNFYIFENLKNQLKKEIEQKIILLTKCKPTDDKQEDIIKYFKMETFNWKYNTFQKLVEDYTLNQYENEKYISPVFWELKSSYIYYYKFLKFLLKQKGVKVLLPKDIIKQAQKENIISDGDVWLSYIEHMNVFYDKQNTDEKYKLMLYIVDNFTQAIQDVCLFVNNDERKEFIKQFKPIIDNYQKEDICLADNLPTYDYREIGISEKSYKILIKFFSSIKNLKSVWIHGSRAYGTYTNGSDIDIIVDCPIDFYDEFRFAMEFLPIPYYIDCKNINSKKDLTYIKKVQCLCTKKIYCTSNFSKQ